MDRLISYLKSKNVGFEAYSILAEEISSEIFNGKVAFVSSGKSCSIGIRIAIGKRLGFSYTDNANDYRKCADAAIASAKNNNEDKEFPGFCSSKIISKMKPSKSVIETGSEWLTESCRKIISDAKEGDKRITVPEGETARHIAKVRVANSEGLDVEESYGSVSASAAFSLKADGLIESIGISRASRTKVDTDFGKEAWKRLESLKGRQSIKSGTYQLILHPEELAPILSESYAFSVNAENVALRKSIFAEKLNEQVFSKNINIIDDGSTKSLLGSRSFDAEGTKTGVNSIIKNGVLSQFISDRRHARMTRNSSTGNASRLPSSLPVITTNNVIIKPGKKKDIFSECDNAIYAHGLLGVHTMNEATGDFSLGVQEGHLIRNGNVVCPLKGVIIAGNFFRMMNSVAEISKKTEEAPNNGCTFRLPYILFDGITVTSS